MTREEITAALDDLTGPSRELDCHIWAALNGNGQSVRIIGEPTYSPPRLFCNPNPEIDWIGYDLLNIAPRYTESMDAAITVVPAYFDWSVSICCRGETGNGPLGVPRYQATVIPSISMQTAGDSRRFGGTGCFDTPAVALCSVAMEARP